MMGPDGLEVSRRQIFFHQRPGGGLELDASSSSQVPARAHSSGAPVQPAATRPAGQSSEKKAKHPPPTGSANESTSGGGAHAGGAKAAQDPRKEKLVPARKEAPGDPRPGSKRPAERDTGDPHASSKRAHTATASTPTSATLPSSKPRLPPPGSSTEAVRPPPRAAVDPRAPPAVAAGAGKGAVAPKAQGNTLTGAGKGPVDPRPQAKIAAVPTGAGSGTSPAASGEAARPAQTAPAAHAAHAAAAMAGAAPPPRQPSVLVQRFEEQVREILRVASRNRAESGGGCDPPPACTLRTVLSRWWIGSPEWTRHCTHAPGRARWSRAALRLGSVRLQGWSAGPAGCATCFLRCL